MSAPAANEAGNRIAPARESRTRRSMTVGDAPETVLRRYLIERAGGGRSAAFYRDHREKDARFVDAGRALRTTSAYPDAVRDMLEIARHRGWSRLAVSGDERFRREVWIQGQTLGLDVAGHRPTSRDRQAAGLDPAPWPTRRETLERLDRAAVVVRALVQDPVAQARLLARAVSRAADRDREADQVKEPKSRDRGR